jgi:UDP-N-acetylmuramyl tripeptide synthase
MRARSLLALWAGKVAAIATRVGGSQGTSFPGLVALRIDPRFIQHASNRKHVTILLSGTNGKTTTARFITAMLEASGKKVLANPAGANLSTGIAAALIRNLSWGGSNDYTHALFEVDEHALPTVAQALKPSVLLLTNLFRDQLDRFGEIDTIASRWKEAIKKLPVDSVLIVNANDPRLIAVSTGFTGRKVFFGATEPGLLGTPNLNAADSTRCPSCGGVLSGDRFMAHLGVLRCGICSFRTPTPDVALLHYRPEETGSKIGLMFEKKNLTLQTPLEGRFNALNLVAAVAVARTLEVSEKSILAGVASVRQAFGRAEHFQAQGREVILHLAKNPTGYNEVLIAITERVSQPELLLALNDYWADGQDASWIWDIDFERMAASIQQLTVSGVRAGDLAIRLATAGVAKEINVEANLESAFDLALKKSSDQPLHIVASYTAMLFLRKLLVRRGLVTKEWNA